MSFFDRFRAKQPRFDYRTGYLPGGTIPPDRDTVGMLSAYSQVGWLHAVVFRIALGCSEVKWALYDVANRDKPKQIFEHPILNLLNLVNPFQTSNEFIALDTIYQELVGESFWILNFNGLGEPAEMWIASPDKMSVIPDPPDKNNPYKKTNFIKGYVYGFGQDAIPFSTNEVIHFKYPSPLNAFRGLGPAQSIAVDLDAELYSGQWNRQFFYNSARPDGILQFDYNLSDEQFAKLQEQWAAKYRGVSKAHQVALLEGGGKYQQIQNTVKDMDFSNLKLRNRDVILGVYGMPLSVMGISENVNKANAEAGEYTFARWIVKPRLDWKAAKLQEQLIPKFKRADKLKITFEEVVPETIEEKRSLAESGMRAGYLTINEARKLQKLDPLPDGDVLLIPLNLVPTNIDEIYKEPVEPIANPPLEEIPQEAQDGKKTKALLEEQKEAHWRTFADHAELYEKTLIEKLRVMFDNQQNRALARLNQGDKRLITVDEATQEFKDTATPVLGELLKISVQDGQNLVHPQPPHRAVNPMDWAVRWLKTRMGWAAEQIGEETARLLAETLADGYAEGEGIPDLAKRVQIVFEGCDKVRALRIARTETIMASNEGALAGYGDLGVEKAEFYAAVDERACEDCLALHQNVFILSDAHNMIPLHPNCRCCWLPVVE